MKQHWRTRRQTLPQPDGQRRWDRAYQLLLEWTTTSETAQMTNATADPPTSPAVADRRSTQEVKQDASRPVCACLDPAAGPAAHRGAAGGAAARAPRRP